MKRIKDLIFAYGILIFGGYTSLAQAKQGLKTKRDEKAQELKERRLSRAEILRRKAQGQKLYRWGELEVWARDEENARRKFQNIVDANQEMKMRIIARRHG